MNILSVGNFNGLSNTCVHRHWSLKKMAKNIDKVNTVPLSTKLSYKIANKLFNIGLPIPLPDNTGANNLIKKLIRENKYDVVWIDKGITINKKTLRYIKFNNPNAKIVSYSPDNMVLRHNQSQNYLECLTMYDYIFTNKSYILEDMRKIGARRIEFINNSYEAKFHYPRKLSKEDYERLGGDVGFIGMWEKERCQSILYLVKNNIQVTVYGGGRWNEYKGYSDFLKIKPPVFSEDYSKALQAFKISLCFLRKVNYDQQTTRSVEIPACGGFMLAERTQEHLNLFEEGEEAVYFSSNEELLSKCEYYLSNSQERERIVKNALLRCESSGYSNQRMIKRALDYIANIE